MNNAAVVAGCLMITSMLSGARRRNATCSFVVRPCMHLERPIGDCHNSISQAATAVVNAKAPELAADLWSPEFDQKLKNAIGNSVTEQNTAIDEILNAEPRLSRASIVSRLVQKLVKHASNSIVERREAVIRQILQLQPTLDRETVMARVNEMAVASLPAWVGSSFWSREIDPILLIGLRNAHQELEAVFSRISSLYPTVSLCQIRERHAHCRSKRCHSGSIGGDEWPHEADQMFREAVAYERRTERETILRVSRQHKELRLAAIQQRLRVLQRRFTAAQQYERFAWSEEINQQLLQASNNGNLSQVVASIAIQYGRSREMVYKHCERLGIPRQRRQPIRRWDAADVQYLMDHVNHQATHKIAEALGRSYSSVVRKIQQFGLSTAVAKYSLRDLRRDIHVHHSTILQWIAEGKLNVALKKRNVKRGRQQHIQEQDLLDFLETHHKELNIAKVEPHIRLVIDDVLATNSHGRDTSHTKA